jgi:hypothetical protein
MQSIFHERFALHYYNNTLLFLENYIIIHYCHMYYYCLLDIFQSQDATKRLGNSGSLQQPFHDSYET